MRAIIGSEIAYPALCSRRLRAGVGSASTTMHAYLIAKTAKSRMFETMFLIIAGRNHQARGR